MDRRDVTWRCEGPRFPLPGCGRRRYGSMRRRPRRLRRPRMEQGLFSDLLVIDCASFIAGPAAATIMSDFGARVIKIEPPGLGDSYRNLFRLRGTPDDVDYFWALDSRNKESLAVDLKQPAARAALDVLIGRADVFIT